MVSDDDISIFKLAAAAVATMRASANGSIVAERGREYVGHAARLRRTSSAWYILREKDGSIRWDRYLGRHLEPIQSATIAWGLVDDWEVDGSAFKCHGIVVEVTIDVGKALFKEERREEAVEEVHKAMEMVHFLVALDPKALKALLRRGVSTSSSSKIQYEDELSALARGIPWEVRFKLIVETVNVSLLQERYQDDLMGGYTSSFDFDVKRAELLKELALLKSPRLERFARIAAHSAFRVDLVIVVRDYKENSVVASEDFFELLREFVVERHVSQMLQKDRKWSQNAPIRIEKIELQLCQFHITHRVLQLSKILKTTMIPVLVSRVGLNFRMVSCRENELVAFIEAATTTTDLVIDTGSDSKRKDMTTTEVEAPNRAKRIHAFVAALGGIKNMRTIDIGGILGLCPSGINREAVWRALFEGVLSSEACDKLTLRIGIIRTLVTLTEEDQQFIAEAADRWRTANHQKTLKLRRLDLNLDAADSGALRALLSAFDDVEDVCLTFKSNRDRQVPPSQELSNEALVAMLRYPSLRKISITSACIQTMDVFIPSAADPRLPLTPVLQELTLSRFQLGDPASLRRFLQQLKRDSGSLSQLENKLQVFKLHPVGSVPVFDAITVVILDEVLASNGVLRHVVLPRPDAESEVSDMVRELHREHKKRFLPGHADKSAMTSKRKIAFLSTLRDHIDTDGSACVRDQLDAALITKIFQFVSNRVLRRIEYW